MPDNRHRLNTLERSLMDSYAVDNISPRQTMPEMWGTCILAIKTNDIEILLRENLENIKSMKKSIYKDY